MQYDFNLTAGSSQVLEVAGTYFTYKNGLGPIRVTPSSGGYVDLLPGQGMSSVKFDRLTIKDLSGAMNAGFILAGTGAWRDERISGTVDVVDGGKARTLAGIAFSGFISSATSGASASAVQLVNPAFLPNLAGANKKNLIVESITVASATCKGFAVCAGAGEFIVPNGTAGNGVSKLMMADGTYPLSIGLLKTRLNDPSGKQIFLLNGATFTSIVWKPVEPIVLVPNSTLTIFSQGVSTDVSASFEWYEENPNAQ